MNCKNCKNADSDGSCSLSCIDCLYTLVEKDMEPCASCSMPGCEYTNFVSDAELYERG